MKRFVCFDKGDLILAVDKFVGVVSLRKVISLIAVIVIIGALVSDAAYDVSGAKASTVVHTGENACCAEAADFTELEPEPEPDETDECCEAPSAAGCCFLKFIEDPIVPDVLEPSVTADTVYEENTYVAGYLDSIFKPPKI